VDIWAAQSVAQAFDAVHIPYSKTENGLPSFTKGFLDSCEHPIAKLIVEARETNKTHSTFLEPYLNFSAKTGRIHPHVNQMRSDDGGTVTGRLSMANPNLQQVPARHEVIGPMVQEPVPARGGPAVGLERLQFPRTTPLGRTTLDLLACPEPIRDGRCLP